MSQVIARELEIRGTHGLQAREYAGMLLDSVPGRSRTLHDDGFNNK